MSHQFFKERRIVVYKSISLTDYVNYCMEYYDIPIGNDRLNFNKIRIKCTRVLKDLGYWDNAETKLVGRNKTKFFTSEQIEELSDIIQPYLLKQSNLDLPKTLNFNLDSYIDKFTINQDISRNEKLMVMIEALFNEKFMLNSKLWEMDKRIVLTDTSKTQQEHSIAQERLSNPCKYYVKQKGTTQ